MVANGMVRCSIDHRRDVYCAESSINLTQLSGIRLLPKWLGRRSTVLHSYRAALKLQKYNSLIFLSSFRNIKRTGALIYNVPKAVLLDKSWLRHHPFWRYNLRGGWGLVLSRNGWMGGETFWKGIYMKGVTAPIKKNQQVKRCPQKGTWMPLNPWAGCFSNDEKVCPPPQPMLFNVKIEALS